MSANRLVGWVLVALTPVVVLGVVVALAVIRHDPPGVLPAGTVTSFEVPLGTAAALRRGDAVEEVFPPSISLRVGDWLELVNLDSETHRLGPVVARARETVRVRFYDAGRFDAQCSVGHDSVLIEVLPP
jgi:hypothetical protein